ncbi:MAG: hydrogenase maturation protein [Betaproteobacteria bacterium HGW-Betaproteobacteria-10]|nr:MAG: hydrogenase maturation protein [Betaproteobacteria bacterium HGW-Betaproteobacteria-10]
MRLLFITHGFNSLTQRLFCELSQRGHEISIEFDIADAVNEEAVALFAPDLIVAPFLKRAIPESIWARHVCLVVHPGIVGDRGPSALDWAIQQGLPTWGVTVLQAEAEMDAGPVWAAATFPLRAAAKSSIYRNETTEAAVQAVLAAVDRYLGGNFTPQRLPGKAHLLMKQIDRTIDWAAQTSLEILARLNAADGFPGVADELFGLPCHVFDAWPESALRGVPGALLGRRQTAICRATRDGALWIGHVKVVGHIKLPATQALPMAQALPELALDGYWKSPTATWQDIAYEEAAGVGFLSFEFYNGAMSTAQCQRLTEAFQWAASRPTQVIVLRGGADFWSNGVHLNTIEAAESPADESWANINAIDDLAEAILCCENQLTVAALAGNAGAGGCFLARAADFVWARDGVILNPHYKNMGNLYGSEFWTYLLPPRVGSEGARNIMRHRLPMSAAESVQLGFYDACLPSPGFAVDVARRAAELAAAPDIVQRLAVKRAQRLRDETSKPLASYRQEELHEMRRNFYGFDPSYHVARYHFVTRTPHSWTPRHLARHRDLDWKTPA